MKVRKKNIVDKMLLQTLNRGYVWWQPKKMEGWLSPMGVARNRMEWSEVPFQSKIERSYVSFE